MIGPDDVSRMNPPFARSSDVTATPSRTGASKLAAESGIAVKLPESEPFDARAPEEVDLSGFGAAIFTSGFRPDYASWVQVPGAFDEDGFPVHDGCASTVAPGLYFVGVHFLRKRKSSLLIGVGEDAALVARSIKGGA